MYAATERSWPDDDELAAVCQRLTGSRPRAQQAPGYSWERSRSGPTRPGRRSPRITQESPSAMVDCSAFVLDPREWRRLIRSRQEVGHRDDERH